MSSPIRSGQYANLPNGVRLHFASAGSPGRPLVLFVHGFPEAWFAWEAQLEAFGARFYAVALDLRGFNLSDKPVDVNAYRPRKIVEPSGELPGGSALIHVRVPAADVRERDLESDVRLDQLRDLPKMLPEG